MSGEHPYEGMDDEDIKEEKRSSQSMINLMKQLPVNTPSSYSKLICYLTKYNPSERLELAIARLELESLFDDDDEIDEIQINQEPYRGDRSLYIDELDDDDEDGCVIEESFTSSSSTTIESGKSSGREDSVGVESLSCESINHENITKSSVTRSVPSRKQSRQSSNSENKNYNPNPHRKGMIFHDRSLVASPTPNSNKNPIIDIPTIPSLESNSIISSVYGKITDNVSGGRHTKTDSGVGMDPSKDSKDPDSPRDPRSQTTLVGSPTTPKKPLFEEDILDNKLSSDDLALIDEVIAITDNWEKYSDDVMRRKLEVLCHEKGIKPKNLLEIFEKNPSKTADNYFIIGFMNEHAFGKSKDSNIAFECYHKAAELGDSRGLVFEGWCYYKGMGTSKDPQKAFNCFQSAADKGCVSAHNNVGWCFDIGFGTSTDPFKAFDFFKSSAEKGYTTAQCRVGVCYEYGRGTSKDLEKALEWYTKAAENGHETAKRRVGELTKIIRRGSRRRSFLVRNLIT
ncbi:hypothetical protein C1645_609207 [Glomus cerebriforme]|uniref:HCP-like protein n=1 Tax=Glomus cerebriforme TaxID=658196 RepID=A0A397T8K2_9GLOM|nr:hypothetical protein C1645_609207 [Glomus cerebriforme]